MQNNCNGAAQSALVPFHQHDSLDSALESFALWKEDQQRYGIGTVALGFDGRHWLVLVSKDLIESALPF